MSLKLRGEGARACVAAPIAIIVCAMAQQSVIGQPPPPTVYPNGVVEGRVSSGASEDSAVAIDRFGRFTVAFEVPIANSGEIA
ncbi:MAG: hypothetical protein V3T70_08670, partial [Phycisphaerae bacterium]